MTVPKDDADLYEMAIRFRKDEDFSGWYQEVSSAVFLLSGSCQGLSGGDGQTRWCAEEE